MDIKRTVLWVIFFVSVVMLFDNWQRDHGRPSMFFPSATQKATTASNPAPGSATPGAQPSELTNAPAGTAAPGTQTPPAPAGGAAGHGGGAARQVHDGRVFR